MGSVDGRKKRSSGWLVADKQDPWSIPGTAWPVMPMNTAGMWAAWPVMSVAVPLSTPPDTKSTLVKL